MSDDAAFTIPTTLAAEALVFEQGGVTILSSARQPHARCPACRRASRRLHGTYSRTLADLPWGGMPVRFRVRIRKFFCDNPDCPAGSSQSSWMELRSVMPGVGWRVGRQSLLQVGVPDRYRGRIFGALGATASLVLLTAEGIAAVLGETLGVVLMLNVAALLYISAGATALLVLPDHVPRAEPAPDRKAASTH